MSRADVRRADERRRGCQAGEVECSADRWVQRLRDGEVPPTWRIVVATLVVTLIGVFLLWQEFVHPEVTQGIADASSRSGALLLVPLVLLVTGPVIALSAWASGRRDRRTLARIRVAGPRPSFHLPVTTSALVAGEEFADPKPIIWTVDDAGLHGWSPDHERPVHELPWTRIHGFSSAKTYAKGQWQDWGIWVTTPRGHVVLAPRTALCRSSGAGPDKLDVILRVLRSLRHELDHTGTSSDPGTAPSAAS